MQMKILRRNAPEERIRKDHIIHVLACWVVQYVPINEEQQRHVHLFSGQQLLFFKTETFHLGEVRCNLPRSRQQREQPNGTHDSP